MAEVIVFAGPCLSRLDDEARAMHIPAGTELRPPAKRGDLLAALSEDPHTLVLLDGYFFQELSVAHKELLFALEAGVRVIGAASMGALRAAEMERFGMIGVGTIFRWFSSGELEGDDEVTILHFPEEMRYRLLTVALVELRHALTNLVALGSCGREDANALTAAVQAYAFSERSADLVDRLACEHIGADAARALTERLDSTSLKEEDAKLALELARAPYERQPPRPSSSPIFFHYWCEDHVRAPVVTTSLPHGVALMRAWNMVQLFHDGAPELVARLRLRYLAASAARRAELELPAERRQALLDQLTAFAVELHGGPVLPPIEIEREAELQVACEVACAAFGSPESAGDWLAAEYGLDARGGHQELVQQLTAQYGLQSSWSLVRSFAFTRALRPALELAEAANDVSGYFQNWSEGARIDRTDLMEVAAELWSTEPAAVRDEGSRRGLLEAHGFSDGLREVLQCVAPAERLPEPVNAYPERKVSLQQASLEYAVEFFPTVEPEQAWLRPRAWPTRFNVLPPTR
jgi:hypothetical protein